VPFRLSRDAEASGFFLVVAICNLENGDCKECACMAAALTQMAISMTLTTIANQSRRMAADCFIVATLSAERGDPRRPRCSSVIAQS